MDPREEWNAQEPSDGFADRVMASIEGEEAAARPASPARWRVRRAGVATGLALAAGLALAIGWRASGPPPRGDAIAADRTQVPLGRRAVAVLEPGARVAWSGDEVNQSAGDVFYRVEPGGTFRVHTPAGDVQVLGTCFRVKVDASEAEMNVRDVKAGAIGAALSAVAFVSVYEGKVAVSHARESVTLTAGESARADEHGVHREGARLADGAAAGDNGGAANEDPLVAANANLADSVREYKRQLETIAADKKTIEKRLKDAEEKLAIAENDGTVPPKKSEFDLTQDDWKKLAQEGKVNAHFPCVGRQKPDDLGDITKKGYAPQDKTVIQAAMDASRTRVWEGTIRPLCLRATKGDAALADRLGAQTCQSLIQDVAHMNGEDVEEEMRQVAEVRAGMRPMPADGGADVFKLMLALSNESGTIEKDLAKSLGPDEAHRVVFADELGCWNNSSWGVGPRPTLPSP
jgi:ferric-dicitrate binding protein FerR (iron transport regulator)